MEMQTTYWMDFSIADVFGEAAVKDTFNRVMKGDGVATSNVDYYAEFVFVLNAKCWKYYDEGKHQLSKLYADLYHEANDKAYEIFKTEEERQRYFELTD